MKLTHLLAAVAVMIPASAVAQEQEADFAKKLANPVADLVSLPFQFNYDCCYGPADGERVTLNIQPVVPIKLREDWNLILRTIVPVISQTGTVGGYRNHLGLGDTIQTFFFSPRGAKGVVWAVGPAMYYPSGTDGFSAHKWAAGPSALVLKQDGGLTYGILATQLWTFAGNEKAQDVETTLLQPFFNYTFPDTTGITLNMESSYNWEREQWTVPVNAGVTHIYKLGNQRVQAGIMGRYYFDSPDGGPDWGVRFVLTYLIPS